MCLNTVKSLSTVEIKIEEIVPDFELQIEPDFGLDLAPEMKTEMVLFCEDIEPKSEPEDEEVGEEKYIGDDILEPPPKKKQKIEILECDSQLEGIFTCYICDAVSSTYKECREHLSKHVVEPGTKAIRRLCKVCNTTPSQCYLKHLKSMHPEHQPNVCKQCGRSYQRIHHLQKHLQKHAKGEIMQCQGCEQQFSSGLNLKNHIAKTKHSTTDYHCHICGFGSPKFAELLLHASSHTSHKSNLGHFPCYSCKNVYTRKQLFQNHHCSLHLPVVVDAAAIAALRPEDTKIVQASQSGPHQCDTCPSTFENEGKC
jgi:hypothetical protein